MRLHRRSAEESSQSSGYVGDHADKLSRVAPLRLDDDERPRREDLDYGSSLFDGSWWADVRPRFLGGRGKQRGGRP